MVLESSEEERKDCTAARSSVRPTRGGAAEEKVVEHRRRERRVVKMDGVGREEAEVGVEGEDIVEKASSEATDRREEGGRKERHTISLGPLLPFPSREV